MDRRVLIENHFEQKYFSSELNEERNFKKYGMYFYKINLKEDSGIGDYASGNSFFELLATFSGVENLQADKYDILTKSILQFIILLIVMIFTLMHIITSHGLMIQMI